MIDCIGVVFAETKIELLGPIELGAVYEKNKIGQQHDQSYKCSLHKKWYQIIMID